mgnify:FL=1
MRLLVAVLFLSLGCSTLVRPSDGTTVSDDCRRFDDSFVAWQAVGIASGSLGGASGASGLLSSALDGSDGAEIGLAATGAVLGALSAVAVWLSGHYAERYAEECGR